ncbi:YD repeat protein [Paenibacillus curdlanolyticus YK9]|uniref:YD repeat protein n=1 Tax=Paenibacillus curdlanolyticus YK9 TaxID=717606 RepID=E0IFK6_9BACL|nr:RHS repeat-associated core domain-containing protein [Paenibacillus curdlanolyticus]EFM08672.1 YD repeat protein [Paenibacillus curdlanolyticus YK9]
MRNLLMKSMIMTVILSMLISDMQYTGLASYAQATGMDRSNSVAMADTPRKLLSQTSSFSERAIQNVLNQGYSIEDVRQAIKQQKVTGGSLDNSLQQVKPQPINRSKQVKSSISSEVAARSLAAASETAVPDYSYVKTKPDEAPFTVRLDNENISTLSGALSLQQSDLSLPGRNGLGFTLSRSYDSGSSQFDQMGISSQMGIGGSSNMLEPSLEEKRFPIGKGWSWNISFLEIKGTDKYLHLAGSGVFKIDASNTLVGYPWKDLTFAADTSVTVNGVGSAYVVKSIQHTNQYFNADGQMIQISDAYNNKITFSYVMDGYYGSVLSAITDSIGNTINIVYNTTSVVLTSGSRSVTYYKTYQNGKELLSQVVDELGRTTTYDYSIKNAQFNLLGTTPSMNNPYALITGVTYPTGAKSVYTYEDSPVTRYIQDNAVNQVYRVKSREDQIRLADSSISHVNHKDITYPSGDIGSSNDADLTFSVQIDDGAIKTTFTNDKDYIDSSNSPVFYNTSIVAKVVYLAKTYTNTTEFTYDRARKWPVPINTKTTRSVSGSSSTFITTNSALYDDYGNIIYATDPMGTVTRNTFDTSTHLLQSVATQINGTQKWKYTVFTRNALGTVTLEQVYAGDSNSYAGSPLRETYYENIDAATGNVGQVRTKNGSPNDTTTVIEYAATYQYAYPTKTTTSVHDSDGNSSTVIKQYQYDMATGRLLKYTDGNANQTSYTYDALGRVLKATQSGDNSTITISYNDALNQLTATDQTGIKTVTKWNPLGWKTESGLIDHNVYKAKSKYGYDASGRLAWTEDAVGNRVQYGYDQWNRQNLTSYPDGGPSSTVVIDDITNTKTSTDPEGYSLRESYDQLGRTIKTEEIKSGGQPALLMSYSFDNAGNMLTSTDNAAPANTTTYAYDVLGQLGSVTNVVNGASQTTSYAYDLMGNMTLITNPDNTTTTKKYDELGRLIQNTEAPVNGKNNIEKFYYDANNNQTRLIDRNGSRFKYTYDSRNLLKKKEIVDASWNAIAGEETISFGYDLAGKRTSLTDQTGTTSYAYNLADGLLASVTYPDNKVMKYAYDENSNRQALIDPFGATSYYHYDARNRLDAVGPSNDFTNDYDAKYDYYRDNLLRQITQRNGVTSSYTYDGKNLNTLLERKADGTALNSYQYTYTANGNIKSKTENGTTNNFGYDELSRIKTSSQYNETYTYDARGNRASMSTNHPFERPDQTTAFDKRDRLTSVTTASGSNVTYRYNGDGQLWERTENGQTTRYYWDGDQIEAEATVVSGVATFKARYIRGQGLIAREDTQTKAYYVANGHGDVTDLMDRSGMTRLNQYSYDIFGNIASQTESIAQPFKYAGEMQDSTTTLQYLRARWYDPSVGRFMSEDTYEGQIKNPLTLNLYTYVSNNPLRYTDPTGHLQNDDMNLSSDDRSKIAYWTMEFNIAKRDHNIAAMQVAHDNAVAIRLASGKYEMIQRTNFTTGKSASIEGTVGGVTEDWLTLGLAVPAIAIGILYAPAVIASLRTSSQVLALGTETSLGTVVSAPGQVITGLTEHALQRAAQRNVTEALMKQTVANPLLVLDQAKTNTYLYLTKEAVVVLNRAGKVVTTYGKEFFDEGIESLLKVVK